jgi:hypothetical protein
MKISSKDSRVQTVLDTLQGLKMAHPKTSTGPSLSRRPIQWDAVAASAPIDASARSRAPFAGRLSGGDSME